MEIPRNKKPLDKTVPVYDIDQQTIIGYVVPSQNAMFDAMSLLISSNISANDVSSFEGPSGRGWIAING